MANERSLNYVLGYVGTAIESLSKDWKETILPIQCLVINKRDRMPGKGIGWFITKKEDCRKLPRREQRRLVKLELEKVFVYRNGSAVLRACGLAPAKADCSKGGMIEEAERLLERAAHFGRIGHFQLEAAIQSVHAHRAQSGQTDWESIAMMYEALAWMAPTVGALVSRAAAVAEARGAEAALVLLKEIPLQSVETYQPYWALSAHLLKRVQRFDEARMAYMRAIGLCEDSGMREFLREQAAELN